MNVVVDNGGFVDDETPLIQSNQDEQGEDFDFLLSQFLGALLLNRFSVKG